MVDVIPERGDLLGTARLAFDLADGAAVYHARGEAGALMEDDRRERAVLRQRHYRFVGDLRAGRGGVDDEDQRLAGALDHLDGGAGGAQIMRARPHRDENEVAELDDVADRRLDRRR